MVNELRELLRENVATPPAERGDLSAVVAGGRRRLRRRRLTAVAGTAVASAAVVGLSTIIWPGPPDLGAAGVPRPDAPTLRLADARTAVESDDYRVLASHTNDNLNQDNGQYFDGVTDDGLILFRDGPQMEQPRPRYALMDPRTGDKAWLPDPPLPEGEPARPVDLGAERLVLTGTEMQAGTDSDADPMGQVRTFALIYDREGRDWQRVDWPGLPAVDMPTAASLGPDDRLYVRVPATRSGPPPGGWPTGPDGEAEDADADGGTYRLWSASLADASDVRDEGITLGDLAFTDTRMVWTDATNGDSGQVHVRDLDTGDEQSFDPRAGERCNLLAFGATDDRVVMSQYCGTYDGVRDDRVQIVSTEGDQVATLQDDSVDGSLLPGSDVVTVSSYQRGRAGTFVYDLASDRFLRLSDAMSSWSWGGLVLDRQVLWNTPVNRGNGATQWLAEIEE